MLRCYDPRIHTTREFCGLEDCSACKEECNPLFWLDEEDPEFERMMAAARMASRLGHNPSTEKETT